MYKVSVGSLHVKQYSPSGSDTGGNTPSLTSHWMETRFQILTSHFFVLYFDILKFFSHEFNTLGAGKIIGGVISLVLGIIIFAASMFFHNVQTGNLEYCNSFAGGLQQGLDSQTAQQCSSAGGIIAAAMGGMLLGGAMALIGLILVIVGGVQLGTKKSKVVSDKRAPKDGSQMAKPIQKTYCRYCGKEKPISGDHCPLCGRSSHSVSTNMMQCTICGASMAEDSNFCSNCSTEFRKTANETAVESTGQSHMRPFEEPKLGIKMEYPIDWNSEISENSVGFYPPTEKELYKDSGFWIYRDYTDMRNLDEYIKESIDRIGRNYEDFKVLDSSKNTTLSGRPAYKLVYIRNSKNSKTMVKRIEVGTIAGRKGYIVNGGSEAAKYSEILPIIEKMISSIQLTKIENTTNFQNPFRLKHMKQ